MVPTKKPMGRPVGSYSNRSVAFFDSVMQEGFDAAKEIIGIFRAAKQKFEDPTTTDKSTYLSIALDAANKITHYSYPVPKIPDQATANALEGMTPEQKLEALKHAALLVEKEIKASGD